MWIYGDSDFVDISIHALRKESDRVCRPWFAIVQVFQSTLSVRRATIAAAGDYMLRYDFNPRSP